MLLLFTLPRILEFGQMSFIMLIYIKSVQLAMSLSVIWGEDIRYGSFYGVFAHHVTNFLKV